MRGVIHSRLRTAGIERRRVRDVKERETKDGDKERRGGARLFVRESRGGIRVS